MSALTVIGNPPSGATVVAAYRGVPIYYLLGRYYLDMIAPGGGRIVHDRLHTERAARRAITMALKKGAVPARRANPAPSRRRGILQSRRVYAVQYKHAEDGRDYEHPFATGVCMELLPDGSIRIYSMKGKRLWKDFK